MPPRSKIVKLPPEVRREVETLLVGGVDCRTIAEHLRQLGHRVSKSSVHRFGEDFLSRLEQLRLMREKADAIVSRVGPGLQMEEATSQIALDAVMQFLLAQGADLAAALSGESLVDVLSVVAKLQSSGVQRERFKSDLRKRVEAAAAKIEKRPEIVALPPEVRAHILQDVYGIVNT